MSTSPLVSVVTITYNHDKYIRQALESFVMQKTNFDFEVVVADDASSDKTSQIIEEYAKAYPSIIKPILRRKNIGAVANSIGSLKAANGKYIALCEGDDYWTDSEKLQRQVDFLDSNPKYALCFHPVRIFFENGDEPDSVYPATTDKALFTTKELLKKNFIQTDSVMYRRQNYRNLPDNILPLDWYLHSYHAQFGKIGFINRPMAAYRRHVGGMWWDSDKNVEQIWLKHGLPHLKLFVEMLNFYKNNSEYQKIIYGHIGKLLSSFAGVDAKGSGKLLKKALDEFPQIIGPLLIQQNAELTLKEKELMVKKNKIDDLTKSQARLENKIDQKNEEVRLIKASRFWQLRNHIARLIGKQVI